MDVAVVCVPTDPHQLRLFLADGLGLLDKTLDILEGTLCTGVIGSPSLWHHDIMFHISPNQCFTSGASKILGYHITLLCSFVL